MPPLVATPYPGRVRLLTPGEDPGPLPAGFLGPGWQPAGPVAALGRGGVVAMDWPDGRACYVRQYRHGGLLRSLLGARYLSERPLRREIEDGLRLRAGGLAVATPVVGRIEGRLLLRLALVTERVAGAPLADWLADPSGRGGVAVLRAVLRRAGTACAHMHELGFRHKDLHPGNLVVMPDGHVAVLDLAGGRWGGTRGDAAARRSLVRLARWLVKHQRGLPSVRNALAFLQGYEPRCGPRRRLLRDLAGQLRGQLSRRRFRGGGYAISRSP